MIYGYKRLVMYPAKSLNIWQILCETKRRDKRAGRKGREGEGKGEGEGMPFLFFIFFSFP